MKNFNRRQFLKSSCGATIGLPILPSLLSQFLSEKAIAATPPPLRFVAIHNGHCQAVEQWLPNLSNINLNKRSENVSEYNLSQISGNLTPVLGSSMDSLRNKILLINRLDSTSGRPNHNAEFILSGGVKGDFTSTLDHVISQKLSGSAPLNLFIKSVFDEYNSGASHVSVLNGNYSQGDFNPSVVFQRLFSSSGGGSGSTGGGSNTGTTLSRRDLLIADRVYQDYLKLKNHSRISKNDQTRLNQHMELLYQVETKLRAADQSNSGSSGGGNTLTCNPTSPINNSPVKSGINSDYAVIIDQMFDVIELAIKCQKTQVATLMLHVYDYFAGNVGFISGISGSARLHEDIGHAGDENTRKMKLALNQFFAQKIARFLKNLDVLEDPTTGRTYLDNSLVLWANDQGALKDTNGHTTINVPVFLAGSAGGFLKTGRYLDYGTPYSGDLAKRAVGGNEYGQYIYGRPYNQLLITIAQAMGLQPSDYQGGSSGFGAYGDWTNDRYASVSNHKTEILPFIKG